MFHGNMKGKAPNLVLANGNITKNNDFVEFIVIVLFMCTEITYTLK